MGVRRREVRPAVVDEPPKQLLELDPEDYRDVALQALVDHPGDGWVAAVAVWRHWQGDCEAWQAERGLVRGVKGWQRQLGPGRAPLRWVRDEFGATLGDAFKDQCPPGCRTHERWRRRYGRG